MSDPLRAQTTSVDKGLCRLVSRTMRERLLSPALLLGVALAIGVSAYADTLFPHKGDLALPVGVTHIAEGEITGIEEGDLYIPLGATLHLGPNATFVWNPGYGIVTDGTIITDTGARLRKGYLCADWQPGNHCWGDLSFSDTAVCEGGTRWALVPADTPNCKAAVVVFPDANLETEVREHLAKPFGDITRADMATLTVLSVDSTEIVNLAGLEYATNLYSLGLPDNRVSDLSPLAGLLSLTYLRLIGNPISDLSPLAGLVNLTELILSETQITDLSPLSGLVNLIKLEAEGNRAADLSPLATLTKLEWLDLQRNRIQDVAPLAGLINLEFLYLDANQITDVSALAWLPNLRTLTLSQNGFSDLSSLATLSKLEMLSLRENAIRNLSPLTGLGALSNLRISSNQITDISPLAELAQLEVLSLDENEIVDLSPLAALSELEWLDLDKNDVESLSPLAGLTRLRSLFAADNHISDLSPLANLTQLEALCLNANLITDLTPLTDLTKLTKTRVAPLELENNRITDISPLVANSIAGGLSSGDLVYLRYNFLDLTPGSEAMCDIQTLTVRGVLVEYEPQNQPENQPPDTTIESYDVSGTSVSISWAGSDDSTPVGQLIYSFRLYGSPDSSWSEWSTGTSKSYSNLAPGEYEFQVRSRDSDGTVDPSPAKRGFVVGNVPVIIIPGILGSHLCTVDSSPRLYLWNPDWKTQDIVSIILDKTLGPILSDPGLELLAWCASENAYGGLADELMKTGAGRRAPFYLLYPYTRFEASGFCNTVIDSHRTLTSADDLFIFAYDWRQDIRDIVTANLKPMIEKVLEVTGAKQVDIVAHSMGGLVARYYTNEAGGAGSIRKLVMAGVPHFGSVNAYSALHPDLGCVQLSASPFETLCLKGVISSLFGSFLSAYELLPMPKFFSLLEYFFIVDQLLGESGPLDGDGNVARALAETYFENLYSKLSDSDAVTTALNFHKRLGSTIETQGEVYVLTEWGIPTPRSLRRTWKPHWIPGGTASLGWSVDFAPGDGRVLAEIAEGLEPAGGTELKNYSLFTSVSHGEMLNDEIITEVVCSIIDGVNWKNSWASSGVYLEQSGTAIDRPALEYSTYEMCSDAVFHLFDATGNHIGPLGDGVIETTPTSHYLVLGDSTVASAPSDGEYRIEIAPCEDCHSNTLSTPSSDEGGEFTFVITQYLDNIATAQFLFENVAVTDQRWHGEIQFNAVSGAPPRLEVDVDDDGNPDSYLEAAAANTPVGFTGVLAFENGGIRIAFKGVESAGQTVCSIVDAPEGIPLSFHPVTPYYAVSSSALICGNAVVAITYEEGEAEAERESSLRIWRIQSADQIVDITTEQDKESNTVSGETDGFSYFVVGYVSHPPDVSILSPRDGEVVAGRSCDIEWDAVDPDGDTASVLVDLLYSVDTQDIWHPISFDLANTGLYHWDISSLLGGQYRLRVVAEDTDGETTEAETALFMISVFEDHMTIGPNPVTGTGTVFFFSLPETTTEASLLILDIAGRLLIEIPLDRDDSRYPPTGTWNPVNDNGVLLANGPYLYVLVADGRPIGHGKMVIQR